MVQICGQMGGLGPVAHGEPIHKILQRGTGKDLYQRVMLVGVR